MANFDDILKAVGALIRKHPDDAEKILGAVDSPEVAVKLTGADRDAYMRALDKLQGNRAQRAKDMGFGNRTWYHGTTNDIESFNPDYLGTSTKAQSAKKGFFFANDPTTAADYSELSPSRNAIRAKASIGKIDKVYYDKLDELHQRYNPQKLEFPDWRTKFENGSIDVPDKEWDNFQSISKARDKAWDTTPYAYGDDIQEVDKLYLKASTARMQWKRLLGENPWDIAQAKNIQEKIDAVKARLGKFPEDTDRLNALIQKYQLDLDRAIPKATPEQIEEAHRIAVQREKEWLAAKDAFESKGQNVLPVRLKGDKSNIHVKDYQGQGYRDTTYSDEMSKAQDDGKTGVLFKNTYDPANEKNRVKQDIAAVFEPNQIRSVNAAFDKRFASSPLLLAGAGAVPQVDMSPLPYLQKANAAYQKVKDAVAEPIANQMDFTPEKTEKDTIKSVLTMIGDPLNFVPGALGVGAGAVQLLGEGKTEDPDLEAKKRALRRLQGAEQ